MKFLTQNNPPAPGIGATGDGYRRIIKRIKNEDGTYKYKQTGKVNIYEKIQEGKEDCLISNIIEKFRGGDLTAINKKPVTQYGDTTIIPNNINDLNNMSKSAGEKYQAMPKELKEKIINGEIITQEDILKAYKLNTQPKEQPKQEQKENEVNGKQEQ